MDARLAGRPWAVARRSREALGRSGSLRPSSYKWAPTTSGSGLSQPHRRFSVRRRRATFARHLLAPPAAGGPSHLQGSWLGSSCRGTAALPGEQPRVSAEQPSRAAHLIAHALASPLQRPPGSADLDIETPNFGVRDPSGKLSAESAHPHRPVNSHADRTPGGGRTDLCRSRAYRASGPGPRRPHFHRLTKRGEGGNEKRTHLSGAALGHQAASNSSVRLREPGRRHRAVSARERFEHLKMCPQLVDRE